MQIFYAPDLEGDHYTLDERESNHTVRVLRMREGDTVRLIDGKGNLYEGVLIKPDPRKCSISISSVIRGFEKRDYRLHIGISPVKNADRFEWFIEKSVEIGIDEITPVICRNTEKTGIKQDRINNIIISAMKQSLKARLTVLNDPCHFSDFICYGHRGNLLIAHCNNELPRSGISEIYKRGSDAVILIGPEGDFSDEEIRAAVTNKFNPVHLGTSRLRSETAGVAACHSIYFINQ